MKSEFLKRFLRNDYANAINYGGDGRYFYRIDPTTNASTVDVVDSTLCTAANYLGSGSWTVNPIIASISLAAGKTYRCMTYDPDREEIVAFSTDNTRAAVIDANPSSGTFNTLLTTLTTPYSGSANTQALMYNPLKKYYFMGDGSTVRCWSRTKNIDLSTLPIFNNQCMWFWFNPHTGDLHSSNTNIFFLTIRDVGEIGNPKLKLIGGGPNNNFAPSYNLNRKSIVFCHPRAIQVNISAMMYPNIGDDTFTDFTSLSTLAVTTNRLMSGNRISSKQNKLFYSTTGLVIGFVDISNPRAISSITTHTRTAISSETSAARLCLNGAEDVLAVEPTGGTPQHMHIYDAVNNSYVGYVSFGKTGINDNTYTSPLICNRWLN